MCSNGWYACVSGWLRINILCVFLPIISISIHSTQPHTYTHVCRLWIWLMLFGCLPSYSFKVRLFGFELSHIEGSMCVCVNADIRCDDRDKPKLEIENAAIFPYLHYYQMDLDSLIRTHTLTQTTYRKKKRATRLLFIGIFTVCRAFCGFDIESRFEVKHLWRRALMYMWTFYGWIYISFEPPNLLI